VVYYTEVSVSHHFGTWICFLPQAKGQGGICAVVPVKEELFCQLPPEGGNIKFSKLDGGQVQKVVNP
jgi:hypothetical protein